MKTQPYDILAWSAAYFRSIAENGETPAKYRFEEISESNARSHSLTKGYLKVLVKQVNFQNGQLFKTNPSLFKRK